MITEPILAYPQCERSWSLFSIEFLRIDYHSILLGLESEQSMLIYNLFLWSSQPLLSQTKAPLPLLYSTGRKVTREARVAGQVFENVSIPPFPHSSFRPSIFFYPRGKFRTMIDIATS